MTTANQVADWLRTLPNARDVRPVSVTIGKQTWPGARYTSVNHYSASMQAVLDGRKKVNEEYTQVAIFLAGPLPKRRKKGTCFPFDGQEWYIACYYEGTDANEFHPFGATFILMPWTHEEKIDKHERFTYDRIPMTVKE